MDVEVFSTIRHLSGTFGTSLAGTGMLTRLRRASIALLGAVTAVGLSLIIFISQLGFPAVFSNPIPSSPTEVGTVHNAIALSGAPHVAKAVPARGRRSVGAPPPRAGHTIRPRGDAAIGGSHRLVAAPSPAPEPAPAPTSAPAQPPSTPVSAPVVQTPPPTPSASPQSSPASNAAAASEPKSSSSGDSKHSTSAKHASKASGPSTAKIASDGSGKPHSASSGRSKGSSSGKPSTETSVKSVSPPPPEAPSKELPEGAAAAKEAANTGESDKSHH